MPKAIIKTYGFDYFETFSLVVKPITIWIVLTLALSYNYTLHLDVQNAFLNEDLHKQVFMHQQEGFINP